MSRFIISVPHQDGSITLAIDVNVIAAPDVMGCKFCGESLAGKRKDALYCSQSCRTAAWELAHPERHQDAP